MARRVVIGAAHTLMQPGQIFQDLKEADLTRKILSKTIPHLEKSGLEFKTVPLDLPLLQRIDWINNTGYKQEEGDIFIEIHVNDDGKKGSKRGIEGWFCGENSQDNYSKDLCETLVSHICDTLKYQKQGVKSETEHDLGSLLILNQTNTISVAVELLYIDNIEDIKILKDDAKLDELAKTLVDGIKKYIDNAKDKPLPKPREKKDDIFGGLSGTGNPFLKSPTLPNLGSMPSLPTFGGAPSTPSTGSGSNMLMDRDQRKQMIIDTYKKMLGEEPKQNDLNYHLNVAVGEDELIRKLATSKEHEDMVKDAIDAKDLRQKVTDLEAENIKLKSQISDIQKMYENQNRLLQHKNQAIMQMQQELVRRNVIKKGQYYDPNRV